MLKITTLLQIFKSRKWLMLIVISFFVLVAIVASFLLPKQYTADAQVALDIKSTDPITGMPVSGLLAPSYMFTQAEIITSQSTALKVVDKLGVVTLPEAMAQFNEANSGSSSIREWFAESFLKGLEVTPSRQSNLINLSFTAADPVFAAQAANAFMYSYISTVAEMKTLSAQKSNEFFQTQLKVLKSQLEKAQAELSKFQEEKGIVTADERLDVETQRLNELTSQLVGVQGMTLDAQSKAIAGIKAPDVLNNPLIQQLKVQVSTQGSKLKEAQEKYGSNHPLYLQINAEYTATKNQLDALSAQYSEGLGTAASNAASRQAALKQSVEAQKEKILSIKKYRTNVDVLQQNVVNAQKNYDLALTRQSQTLMESSYGQTNIFPLKIAVAPKNHSSPKKFKMVLIAAFLGLLASVAAVLLTEFFYRYVRSAEDLGDILNVPVIAALPKTKPNSLFKKWLRLNKAKA